MRSSYFYYAVLILDKYYQPCYYNVVGRINLQKDGYKMIKLINKQGNVIKCDNKKQALKYVNDNSLCVWNIDGDTWEIRPRKEMFKGLKCITY